MFAKHLRTEHPKKKKKEKIKYAEIAGEEYANRGTT
jgi:hypothetical protein